MNNLDQFLKIRFDELDSKFREAHPDEVGGLYKYIDWWTRQEHQKSILYYDSELLSSLSDTFFQDQVLSVFQEVKTLE